MADDSSQIWIGEDKIGLRGLKGAIEEVAQSHANRTDAEIRNALLERLSEKNYIASCARKEYGEAFLREYRKFLGKPYEQALRTALHIEILGPGCAQCDRLEQTVKQALSEMALPASVEHVTDIKEIAKYGVVRTPALIINGRMVHAGTVPQAKKIKEWLSSEADSLDAAKNSMRIDP
jgi:small redox-active disulfide protein 2